MLSLWLELVLDRQLQTPWIVEITRVAKAGAIDLVLNVIARLLVENVEHVEPQLNIVLPKDVEVMGVIQVQLPVCRRSPQPAGSPYRLVSLELPVRLR